MRYVQSLGYTQPVMEVPGRTMKYWLARTLYERREAANPKRVSRARIARLLEVETSTIFRFEKGERFPDHFDRVVAAYAFALGIDDGRELWQEALEAWRTNGQPPTFKDDPPPPPPDR